MKNLIYYSGTVISYEGQFKGEALSVGKGSELFTGSENQCRRKVKELGLDYGDFDLSSIDIPSCTPRQIRLWLLSMGITDAMILGLINQIQDLEEKAITLVEYQYASEFHRSHPFVDSIGAALGLSEEEIDNGFIVAGSL